MNGLQGADAYCMSQAIKAKKADPSSALSFSSEPCGESLRIHCIAAS